MRSSICGNSLPIYIKQSVQGGYKFRSKIPRWVFGGIMFALGFLSSLAWTAI